MNTKSVKKVPLYAQSSGRCNFMNFRSANERPLRSSRVDGKRDLGRHLAAMVFLMAGIAVAAPFPTNLVNHDICDSVSIQDNNATMKSPSTRDEHIGGLDIGIEFRLTSTSGDWVNL
jgi:hypothetical protein